MVNILYIEFNPASNEALFCLLFVPTHHMQMRECNKYCGSRNCRLKYFLTQNSWCGCFTTTAEMLLARSDYDVKNRHKGAGYISFSYVTKMWRFRLTKSKHKRYRKRIYQRKQERKECRISLNKMHKCIIFCPSLQIVISQPIEHIIRRGNVLVKSILFLFPASIHNDIEKQRKQQNFSSFQKVPN